MDSKNPTKNDIKELVSFLPILYNDDKDLYKIKIDGKHLDGFYRYNHNLNNFIRLVVKPCWMVSNYSDELVKSNNIETASLDDIKRLLTFCAQGEKFSEGVFARMVENKIIKRVLERLSIILKKY